MRGPSGERDQYLSMLKAAKWLEKLMRQTIANSDVTGERRKRLKENADHVCLLVNDLEDELAVE